MKGDVFDNRTTVFLVSLSWLCVSGLQYYMAIYFSLESSRLPKGLMRYLFIYLLFRPSTYVRTLRTFDFLWERSLVFCF